MSGPGESEVRRVGGYVLERRLGAGAMGVVYLGRSATGRQVAVKVVRPEYAEDPLFLARFRREVAAARKVSGAFTVPVVDADPEGSPPWLATQYVPGQTLAERVRDGGPLPVPEAARVAGQLAEALRDIHRQGIVHRDLKPANVLLARDGARVIDFGISWSATATRALTHTGVMVGTPAYMAPEQLEGPRRVGPATDVFALGSVVAFAVTGHSPFEDPESAGLEPFATAYAIVHREPLLDAVPGGLRELVARCLVKDPDGRPSVPEVLELAADADSRAGARPRQPGPQDPSVSPVPQDPSVPSVPSVSPVLPAPPATPKHRPTRRRALLAVGLAAGATTAVAAGAWALLGTRDGDDGGGDATDDRSDVAPSGSSAPRTLTPVWERDPDVGGELSCNAAGPAAGPLFCAGMDDGMILTLDPASGDVLWDHSAVGADGSLQWSGAEGHGDVALLAAGGVIRAFAMADGAELAQAPEPEYGWLLTPSVLVVERGAGLVFQDPATLGDVGSLSVPAGYLVRGVYDLTAGVLVERIRSEGHSAVSYLLVDARGEPRWPAWSAEPPDGGEQLDLYVGEDDGVAHFLAGPAPEDPSAPVEFATAVHRLALDQPTWTRVALPGSGPHYTEHGQVTFSGGVGYAYDGAGTFTAFDAADGTVGWRAELDMSGYLSGLTVAGEVLLFTDPDGRLTALDLGNGSLRWTAEPSVRVPGSPWGGWSAPVVLDDRVFAVTSSGLVYAVDLPD
ncbi:protein kinase domain-containing protein [Streptomyces sp. 4N509B]|uniref:protein kinase domain-containing protein n=1 Tax=Streptomyces sp. 4N509B TaxID=3457413 RepID=UPI003FD4E6EE